MNRLIALTGRCAMIIAGVFAVNDDVLADPWRKAKILSDFENSLWKEKFTLKGVTLELSEEQAPSLKATFTGFRIGQRNRLLHFNLENLGATNWEG